MMEMVLLGDKAHCRFGDKGDTGLFVLIPYEPADFAALVASVTPARISQHFGDLPSEQIDCIACPQLGALVIVTRHSLGGGVTRSLALDAHGKTRSGYLLGMSIAWPALVSFASVSSPSTT
jgi:hypothetical protein